MTDRSRVRLARGMAVVAIGSAFVGLVWTTAVSRGFELLWSEWLLHNGVVASVLGLIVWLVIPHQPRNGAIWTSAWVGTSTGLYCLVFATSIYLATTQGLTVEGIYEVSPSELPPLVALVPMVQSWLFTPMILLVTVGLILFPDGRLPSPRWRWVVWASVTSIIIEAVVMMWVFRPTSTVTYGSMTDFGDLASIGPLVAVTLLVQMLMVPVSIAGMIVRFRRSTGPERQQFRLVVWGAAVTGALVLMSAFADIFGRGGGRLFFLIGLIVLIGSYGVAIGKYRLYDIDVVISRTLVYGLLALFIGVVYIGIAVVPWIVLGSEAENNAWLGILATVVVAVSFQPLRRRLQRFANRIVYGRRATPYEVLSSFSQGVSAVDPEVLTQVAKSLAGGTTADSASIWVGTSEDAHRIALWPEDSKSSNGAGAVAPVLHADEELGRVELSVPPGQPFPETDQRLLNQVASGLGLALRNLQLTDDLTTRVDELRESRRRVVALQDQTRRLLERDLHDGAQQRLVALKIKIGLASTIAKNDQLEDIERILDDVKGETDLTIDSLRNLARGIYPPLLEAEGLGAALSAQLRRAPIPVTVQAAGIGRYPQEIEATFYFCVLEAVQNVVKHARAESIQITLREQGNGLAFEVRDDGIGFDVEASAGGLGLINMADRMDAVGGALEVSTSVGRGTVVGGSVPEVMVVRS